MSVDGGKRAFFSISIMNLSTVWSNLDWVGMDRSDMRKLNVIRYLVLLLFCLAEDPAVSTGALVWVEQIKWSKNTKTTLCIYP